MDTKNNIPISQIENQAITLGNDDLILVSTKNGDGTYTSKKMKFSDLKTQIPSSTPILENGTVGVIDGTLLKSPATTVTTADALNNVKSYTYAVENDCYLVIRLIQSAPDGKDIKVYVNNSLVCQEYLIDTNDFSEPTTIAFPVKKLSQVEVKLNSNFSANSTLTFFEYKLFSTNPQIGFPDYDHVQVVNLPSEWTGGDLQFIAPSDGYVSLYIISQGSDNPRWKLLVNNEIICYQDNDYGGQETLHVSMLPVRKNDTVRISYYDGGEYGNITSDSFFNFYPITSSGDVVIDDIHCGVIDGTVLIRTPKRVSVVPEVQLVYTVQNDCCLMIHEYPVDSEHDSQGYDTAYYLDEDCTLPIWTHSESYQARPETWGSMIPLKSGSNIYVRMENYAGERFSTNIDFIEYKLHDIRGQVAFPDYDANWVDLVNISNGSHVDSSSYTVTNDGYINVFNTNSTGNGSNDHWDLKINNKILYWNQSSDDNDQATMYPVSTGDVVSWTKISTASNALVKISFIPIKQKYKEIQNVTTISGGGVIDGTKYTLSNGNTERILTNIVFPSDATTATYLYTTENDCALYMECTEDSNNDIDCKYWLDAEMTCPIYKTIDKYDGDGNKGVYQGTTIFLKAGTKIYGSSPLYAGNTYLRKFRFIEYKITSINPQAAFPDWDISKKINLLSSTYKSQIHHTSDASLINGYTVEKNGYIILYDEQSTELIETYNGVLYVNDIKTASYMRATAVSTDSVQTPSVVPVSKGDVVKLIGTLRQDASGWASTDGYTVCQFYPAKVIEQNGSQTIVGGSGGVIDGTSFELVNGDSGDKHKKTYDSGKISDISYTVENDCLLYVHTLNNGEQIRYYINENEIYHGSPYDDIKNSCLVPVKSGSTITVGASTDVTLDATNAIIFVEYKLNSIAPQIAMPDYSSDPEKVTNNWIAQKNGWLLCNYDSGQSDSEDSQVKIDNVIVYKSRHGSSGYDVQSQPALIPISKGSTVNIVVSSGSISVKFYPCKSQPQPDCASYVIETGRFNSSTGLPAVSPDTNDSWYRLYSDGWCEQGGLYDTESKEGNKDYTLTFAKEYADINYTFLGSHSKYAATPGTAGCRDTYDAQDQYGLRTTKSVAVSFRDSTNGSDSKVKINWEVKGFIS